MVNRIIFPLVLFFLAGNTRAENNNESETGSSMRLKRVVIVRPTAEKGLLRFQGTIAYGRMFSLAANNIYLHGDMEYFPDNGFSVKSDIYFFLNSFSGDQPFKQHHSLFSGVMFHSKTESKFVPFAGIQAGINVAEASSMCLGQPCIQTTPPEPLEVTLSPLVSATAGLNYFSPRFFHLFMQARYVGGVFADNYNRVKLGEFRLSFGLGFHLYTKGIIGKRKVN
ncbi:MAG: hypothetical protein ACOZCO_05655 [Bacteroidota bacterium]